MEGKAVKECSYDTLPLLLSVKEMAEVLNIGLNTAYRLLKEKEIPSVRVGRQHRISKKALIAYIEHRESESV